MSRPRVVSCLLVCLTWTAQPGAAQDPAETPLGSRAAFGVLAAGPTVYVPADTPLRRNPDSRSATLLSIQEASEVPILERDGEWVRTIIGETVGWVAPDGEPQDGLRTSAVGLGLAPLVLDLAPAERRMRIAAARLLLGAENSTHRSLGPFPFYTDVTDAKLLDRLDRIASALPETYRDRFGLEPDLTDPPTIVLYDEEASYREFARQFFDLKSLHSDGHADSSMATLYVGDNLRSDLESVFVHELTHLLNRRAFDIAPQTWLEEGLASDLGISKVGSGGAILPGTLGGEQTLTRIPLQDRRMAFRSVSTGGRVIWAQLLDDWRSRRADLHSTRELLELPWQVFVEPEQRATNYALAAFLVRHLLDQSSTATAAGFRAFLQKATAGQDSGAEALAASLGWTVDRLESRFEHWLTAQTVAAR